MLEAESLHQKASPPRSCTLLLQAIPLLLSPPSCRIPPLLGLILVVSLLLSPPIAGSPPGGTRSPLLLRVLTEVAAILAASSDTSEPTERLVLSRKTVSRLM